MKKEITAGVITSVIGGVLLQVSTGVFSNIGDQLNELIFPGPVLNTTIYRVTDANNKNIQDGGSTKSTTVMFDFKGYKNGNEDRRLMFECKMDLAPVSSCSNGEVYPNLSIGDHWFRVKAIAKDAETSPDTFNFNIITSALIEGRVENTGKPQSNVNVYLNTTKNETTDVDGGFIMADVSNGRHQYRVVNQGDDLLTCGQKHIKVGTITESWTIPLTAKPNATEIPESSACKNVFKPTVFPANYEIRLNQIGVRMPDALKPPDQRLYNITLWVDGPEPILERIGNVTYYLDEKTFNPSVIPSSNPNTSFALSFTAWGMFDVKAKVYFKDVKDVQDLTLSEVDWKFRAANLS